MNLAHGSLGIASSAERCFLGHHQRSATGGPAALALIAGAVVGVVLVCCARYRFSAGFHRANINSTGSPSVFFGGL